MTKKMLDKTYEIDLLYSNISDVIKILSEYEAKYPDSFLSISVDDYQTRSIIINYTELETDKEYESRIKREQQQKEKNKKNKAKNEEKERKEYERLKRIYGND